MWDKNSYHGFYAPYPYPIPVTNPPDEFPFSEPRVALCINEFWYPYVQGAIKALAREETYVGEYSVVKSWVAAAHDLINMEPEPCGVTECRVPNFEVVIESDTWSEYTVIDGGQLGNEPFWVIGAMARFVHLKFRLPDVLLPVGVHFDRCHLCTNNDYPNINWTVRDCLGTEFEGTEEDGRDNYELTASWPFANWAEIKVSCDSFSLFSIKITGDYVCADTGG